ncbi:hypothetical protein K439DRAFT_1626077 [Ramaria rubella]|nr:hypothetical protein K439DRAFT_1626077 [Ramaria rubella]
MSVQSSPLKRAANSYAHGSDDDIGSPSKRKKLQLENPAGTPTKRFRGSSTKTPSPSKSKKPPATDESSWRVSTVSNDAEITSGDVTRYRLSKTDLSADNLTFRRHETDAGYESHLYSEQAVERLAWKKHGSPEGWDYYLDKLKEAFQRKHPRPGKFFLDPRTRNQGRVYISSDALARDPDYLPPRLVQVKAEFSEQGFKPWVWEECCKQLTTGEGNYKRTAEALRLALVELEKYPPRPTHALKPSPSVDHLREVLFRAPRLPEIWCDEDPPGIESIYDHIDGHVFKYWDSDYTTEIRGALRQIVEKHGVGSDGLATARWEVYDKYVECIEGITYDRYGAHGHRTDK